MIRTQVYLPENQHRRLKRLAREEKTTLAELIRLGADQVLSAHGRRAKRRREALDFWANPPQQYRVRLPKPAHTLVREERDASA